MQSIFGYCSGRGQSFFPKLTEGFPFYEAFRQDLLTGPRPGWNDFLIRSVSWLARRWANDGIQSCLRLWARRQQKRNIFIFRSMQILQNARLRRKRLSEEIFMLGITRRCSRKKLVAASTESLLPVFGDEFSWIGEGAWGYSMIIEHWKITTLIDVNSHDWQLTYSLRIGSTKFVDISKNISVFVPIWHCWPDMLV